MILNEFLIAFMNSSFMVIDDFNLCRKIDSPVGFEFMRYMGTVNLINICREHSNHLC